MADVSEELLYRIDDRPPPGRTVLLALQHILAMFASTVAVPIIIGATAQGGALKAEVPFMISCALFCAGAATLIQVRRIGRVGSGLPIVMGTSFTFLGPGLAAANAGGLAAYFGCTAVGSFLEGGLAFCMRSLRKIFPPIVSGTVICLIGLTLMPVALLWLGGGAAAKFADPPAFGAPSNLLMGFSVLAVIVLLSRFGSALLASGAVFFGLSLGYLWGVLTGAVDFSGVSQAPWLMLPTPFRYGFTVEWAILPSFLLAYAVTTIETVGDTMAVADVSGVELDEDRLRGSILADAVGSAMAGAFNAGANTSFSQNVGIIPLTRVASRHVVSAAGVLLLVAGFLPKLAALIALIPQPALGGAGIALFGMISAAGIKIVSREELDSRRLLILAVSLGVGMISAVGSQDCINLFGRLPDWLRILVSSGITTGGISAVALNLLLSPGSVRRSVE